MKLLNEANGNTPGILRGVRVGLWTLELEPDCLPRLLGDAVLCRMLGIDPALSPEYAYSFWSDRVAEPDRDRIMSCIQMVLAGSRTEVRFRWQHPTRGMRLFRLCAVQDQECAYPRLMGVQQDVTHLAEVRADAANAAPRPAAAAAASAAAQNAPPVGVAVFRRWPDGRVEVKSLSEGFLTLTGLPRDAAMALCAQSAMAPIHGEDREMVARTLRRYFAEGREYMELRLRLRCGDGNYLPVRGSFTATPGQDGARDFYCVFRDASREQQELDQLRDGYRDQLMRHYHVVGPDTLLLGHGSVSSDSLLEVIDYTGAGLGRSGTGRSSFFRELAACIPDRDERQSFLGTFSEQAVLDCWRRGENHLSETVFLALPGVRPCYAQFKTDLVQEPDTGELTGILTVTDVTEIAITRQILSKLSLFGCDMAVDVDLDRDSQMVLTWKERPHEEGTRQPFTAYSAAFADVLPTEEDRTRMRKMLDPAYIRARLAKEDAYSFTYTYTRPGGEQREQRMTLTAVDLRLGRVCMLRSDITEIVQSERRTRAALEDALAAARAASQAKSSFLSNMSHDIRTPLNAVMGFATLAVSHAEEPDRVRDYLSKVLSSGRHLLDLINEVLDMSRIESGRLQLEERPVDLTALVREAGTIAGVQAQERGVELTVDTLDVQQPMVSADPTRLSQVLLNLLSNAVKFTPSGGTVRLRLCQLADITPGCGQYEMTVRDSGIGMSAAFVEHLFEPFEREQTAEVNRIQGTGLGMAITKSLVERMGGAISVQTAPGQGTLFTVRLPLRVLAAAAPERRSAAREAAPELLPARPPADFAGRRVLLAEDNELNREIATEILRAFGLEVDPVSDGTEAVERLEKAPAGHYDALLMDMRMPVMDGLQATRVIRALADPGRAGVPVIAMTANAFEEDRRAALDAGMTDFVTKPIELPVLTAVLRRALNGR